MSSVRQSNTLEEVWEKAVNDIDHLFRFQTVRYSQWMLLYTYIFDYCTNSKHNQSADLYEKLRNYLKNYLENLSQSIHDSQEQDMLELYINQWNKYRISSKIFHGICSYLHRHYVERERASGNTDICELFPMAMQIWQQIVPRKLHSEITQICLNMIKAERNHQKIDTEIINNIIRTYCTK